MLAEGLCRFSELGCLLRGGQEGGQCLQGWLLRQCLGLGSRCRTGSRRPGHVVKAYTEVGEGEEGGTSSRNEVSCTELVGLSKLRDAV